MTTDSQTGFAATAGTQLYWEQRGAGKPVVLIHAGIADSRMWEPQLAAFSPHYRTVRYDTRGFGRSRFGTGPFSYRGDVIAILDALDIDRAHLVGLSFGGSTALETALEFPARVRSLVLGATAPRGLVAHTNLIPVWEEVDALIEAGKIDEANELEARIWVDGPVRATGDVDPAIRNLVLEMNRVSLAAVAEQIDEVEIDPPVADRLDEISVPTLILAGEYDQPASIAGPMLLADRIPNAEFLMVHGAAHMLTMEQPEIVNAAVLDFLQRHQAETA
ncbi:MAG: alpha/beta fold hydrolase [Chloroflexota bacterium]|nr:alpha/beta fold hydrolase [Chloroflexota bacterium]